MVWPKQTLLSRYADQLGHLLDRDATILALQAAREEAEAQTRQAQIEIARRIQAQERLSHAASHDSLTGLPNRALFTSRLGEEIESCRQSGRSLAVLYFDLDHFKDVNDTLGHAAGDDLLRVIAHRVGGCLRSESMVARMGGDEFAIWAAGLDDTGATALAQRLIKTLGNPLVIADNKLFVGISVGVALCPRDGNDVAALLAHADIAMYRAKQEGRNRFSLFDPGLNLEVRRRALLEQGLHDALLHKQVSVSYQPQVEIGTGRIVGAEALLRWTSPIHGPVSPAEFVPIAERCGLISSLGAWVLKESCRQAVCWTDAGLPPIRVAVNLAAAQFHGCDVPRLVADTLEETALVPERLELELTETGIMHDIRDAATTLRALAALGVTLAIDDFGTGYSSLSYLCQLPVDKIKIDRSFVTDVLSSKDAALVATSIVRLARGLRLGVVAEGVETVGHAQFVHEVGCGFAQGYYYAEPLAPDVLAQVLANGDLLNKRLTSCSDF